MTQSKRIQILLPVAVNTPFDYALSSDMTANKGDYVRVPFGRKEVIGIVWAEEGDPQYKDKKVRNVKEVLDLPPLSEKLMKFVEWVADYNMALIGAVLAMVVGKMPDTRRQMSEKKEKDLTSNVWHLTSDQRSAFQTLTPHLENGFNVILLDGVTGSGKTEVYFAAIKKSLAGHSDHQTLILLPEIALTSQLIRRVESRLGIKPTLWHSGLTPKKRSESWRAITNGQARLVIGARSALFLPYKNLSLIIVDEEHDASYKQEEGVIYQARDMAVVRSSIEKIPVILVSATPSLETVMNVQLEKYSEISLRSRFGEARLPEISAVDLRQEKLPKNSWISEPLRRELALGLARGEQSLLYLNRRGYAPLTICRACGHHLKCPNCSSYLVEHRYKKPSPSGRGQGEGKIPMAKSILENARNLRKQSTDGESLVWNILRNNNLGFKFRRQHQFNPYILDFYCDKARLVVELDGGQHADQVTYDEKRTKFLEKKGLKVIRFWNNDVMENIEGVVEVILFNLPSPHPLPEGEGFIVKLQCHHCGYTAKMPEKCPSCQVEGKLVALGPGIERLEEEVKEFLPEACILNMSSDVISTPKQMREAFSKIENREVDIIIGTQMVAKGHHFPQLTLVGIIDADSGLHGSDIRGAERTFQVLQQVSGRAGREKLAGKVLIQSFMPENRVIQTLISGDRKSFIAMEKMVRQANHLPPFGKMAALIISGKNELNVKKFCTTLAKSAPYLKGIDILGPAPAPLTLLRGNYRYRFLIKAQGKVKLQNIIRNWLERIEIPSSIKVRIDIDPYSFM